MFTLWERIRINKTHRYFFIRPAGLGRSWVKGKRPVESAYTKLEDICEAAATLNILCVGDAMLDRFVYGQVERVSPEAPIPVLRQSSKETMLGAVGNVARNLSSMGCKTSIASVIGTDAAGGELVEALEANTNITGELLRSPVRQTTVKSRYIAGGQQLLRVDEEVVQGLTPELEEKLCVLINDLGKTASAILLSDYAKGVVTPAIISACLESAETNQIPLIVDPKGIDFQKYGAPDVIKPNASELSAFLGYSAKENSEIEAGLEEALSSLEAKALLVTRSAKGLSFLEKGGVVTHLPAEKREVFDVSGAGDTSLAALGIALAAGASLEDASRFALIASGIVVGKTGTATVSIQELRAAIAQKYRSQNRGQKAHLPLDERITEWRKDGLTIGFTNGCFDILHAGHLATLEFAAAHCDRLIVGLNSDASVSRLKGPTRPVNSQVDRARLLNGLKPVDAVVIFEEDTPLEIITRLQPDLLVKGGDYDANTIVGADVVISKGGVVLIAPTLEGRSTTNILKHSDDH